MVIEILKWTGGVFGSGLALIVIGSFIYDIYKWHARRKVKE